MLQVLDDFVWVLRGAGFSISVPQAVDAARATREVGFTDRAVLREALACVLADTEVRRGQLFELFDSHFCVGAASVDHDPGSMLIQNGWRPMEVEVVRELWSELAKDESMLALKKVLASTSPTGTPRDTARRGGQDDFAHLEPGRAHAHAHAQQRVRSLVGDGGLDGAQAALSTVAERLTEAFGRERSRALVSDLRDRIESSYTCRGSPATDKITVRVPFADLSSKDVAEVHEAIRVLTERLRGAFSVRRRHARFGRYDGPKTLRSMLQTGAVPFVPKRRRPRDDRPKLAVLCDVSEPARPAARIMLEFLHALAGRFAEMRSFVFVNEVTEVTELFTREPVEIALAKAAGSVVNVRTSASYTRAFSLFEQCYLDAVDRRTTLVILANGCTECRSADGASVRTIRDRAKRVLWLCTQATSCCLADSAVGRRFDTPDERLRVACAADLERAARCLLQR